MTKTRVRILTLCLSSLFAAAMVFASLRWLRPKGGDSVRMQRVDGDTIFRNIRAASKQPDATSSDPARSVLAITMPLFPPSTFKRRPLTDEELALFYPNLATDKRVEPDPWAHFHYRAHISASVPWPEHLQGEFLLQTNALGMREVHEVLEQRPDVRILVVGDSHTDGACFAEETYTNVLERALAARRPGQTIEALNAGTGGTCVYNYLGMLERFLWLAPDVLVVGFYGGNDFEDLLTLHHFFQGTRRPAGTAQYMAQLEPARKISSCAVAQAFLEIKDFELNPGEIEIALQGVRDVSTEIIVDCQRGGIHPIFVYIPPMHSVEFEQHRQLFEDLSAALDLSPEDLRIPDRMADSYIAYLRSMRVDVIDMRPQFAASKEELYWQADHHINVKAHELIGHALLPLVEAACPPGAVRARAIGTPTDFTGSVEGVTAGSRKATEAAGWLIAAKPKSTSAPQAEQTPAQRPKVDVAQYVARIAPVKVSDQPLKRIALSSEEVEQLFQLRADQEYDADSLFRYESKLSSTFGRASFATNSSGLLGASEPTLSQPNVLLLGDETVFAPGDEGLTCGALIERAQAKFKCLDACTAGYGLFNYLGTLERLREQKPSEVVVVVDSATDVGGVIPLYRATQIERESKRQPRAPRSLQDKMRDDARPKPGQDRLVKVARPFRDKPANLLVAARYAAEVVLEISRQCETREMHLTVIAVPPASDPRVHDVVEAIAKARAALPGEDDDFAALSRLHAAFIATLEEHAISVIDFGATLDRASAPLVDPTTLRLNANGRGALAELIARNLVAKR